MPSIVRYLMCTALAAVVFLIVVATTRHYNPSLYFEQARMYGTCAFCVVLLVCLIVMSVQARLRER